MATKKFQPDQLNSSVDTRSLIYKDLTYKDQNFPSTERLCSDDVIVTT